MKEIINVRQVPNEAKRRWFTSTVMDLIVWLDEEDIATGFQLCYDKGQIERAITWSHLHGFTHMMVDDGESLLGVGYKATPVLVSGGAIDIKMVNDLFKENRARLPEDIVSFVTGKLGEFSTLHQDARHLA
ncbi:MAG: hypothetical protein ACXWIN_04775 [Burkholderiaceae bacterium]